MCFFFSIVFSIAFGEDIKMLLTGLVKWETGGGVDEGDAVALTVVNGSTPGCEII